MCVCAHGAHVEVRGQLAAARALLPLCGFLGSRSGLSGLVASTVTSSTALPVQCFKYYYSISGNNLFHDFLKQQFPCFLYLYSTVFSCSVLPSPSLSHISLFSFTSIHSYISSSLQEISTSMI